MSFTTQDTKIISVFEIIGSYVVDIMFNYLYTHAKSGVTGTASLTDEYISKVNAYVIGTKTDSKCYTSVVNNIHKYFTNCTRYTTLSFADFIDKIVGICIPEEYFSHFSNNEKDGVLNSIICDLITNLAAQITMPDMLRRIIDNHKVTPDVTVRMLQDSAVNILLIKRTELMNKFFKKKSQARDSVPMDAVEHMKTVICRLAREKSELLSKIDKLETNNKELKSVIRQLKEREVKMVELMRKLKKGNDEGRAEAGNSFRVPKREHIAERSVFNITESIIPKRDTIAEKQQNEPTREQREPVREQSYEKNREQSYEKNREQSYEKNREPVREQVREQREQSRKLVTSNFFKSVDPIKPKVEEEDEEPSNVLNSLLNPDE